MNVVLVNQLNKSDVVKVGEKGFQLTITNGMPKVYYPATSAGVVPAARTSAGVCVCAVCVCGVCCVCVGVCVVCVVCVCVCVYV